MEIIYNKEKSNINKPVAVGLGNFDGLHIGHMVLINTLISESRFNSLSSLLYNFTKHPENILRKKLITPIITSVEKKIELLNETHLDYIFFEEFDEKFSRLEPEEFVRDILVGKLGAKFAVSGYDYRFGYKGRGDTDALKLFGKKYGFKVLIVDPVKIDHEIISSTSIRNSVEKGDMVKAFKYLGRHFSISGTVENGRQIGREIGFPTANIIPLKHLLLPEKGVYVTRVLLNGTMYDSITNIGNNPTFGDQQTVSIETHLLDFSENLYGKQIEVFFLEKVRGEKKFSDKEQLIIQIDKDIRKAKKYYI